MEIIIFTGAIIITLIILYGAMQLKREHEFNKIMSYWDFVNDVRFDKYTFTDTWKMIRPCAKNWFGLKIPNEKDYK